MQTLQQIRSDVQLHARRVDQQQHQEPGLLLLGLQQRFDQCRGHRGRRAQPRRIRPGGGQVAKQPGVEHQEVARLRHHLQQFGVDLPLVERCAGGIGRGQVA